MQVVLYFYNVKKKQNSLALRLPQRMIFYHYKLNEDIFRVDGLFCCLCLYCDTSRLCDRKKNIKWCTRFSKTRIWRYFKTALSRFLTDVINISFKSVLHLPFFFTRLSILRRLSGTNQVLLPSDYHCNIEKMI